MALGAGAQTQQPGGPAVYTVTHVDLMPDKTAAIPTLEAYVAQERRDAGVAHVELLQSDEAPNHFTLIETFRSRAAYDSHAEAAYTRRYRAQIAPALGSPYDEKRFHLPSLR